MCHVNATCINSTDDDIHCECNTAFDGDGINCTSKYAHLIIYLKAFSVRKVELTLFSNLILSKQ